MKRPGSVRLLYWKILYRISCVFAAAFGTVSGHASGLPDLFFYPPLYRFQDGRPLNSPQTMSLSQITTSVPYIREMSGVVLLVYWSTLCPNAGQCDFALIDKTLTYWAARGKKVILAVATMGYPIMLSENGELRTLSATPEWVLKSSGTYAYPARLLGVPPGSKEELAIFPDFRSSNFVQLVARLVQQLARYDGNPTIETIRIATGLMGEDNPRVGPVSSPMTGYREQDWLKYSSEVAELYIGSFHRSRLEFDIARLSWLYAMGSDADRKSIDGLIRNLLLHGSVLAFDGLDSDSLRLLHQGKDSRNGVAVSLNLVRMFKEQGGRIGLEAIGLLSSPRMSDISSIAQSVKEIRPDRLVFFTDVPQRISEVRATESFGTAPTLALPESQRRTQVSSLFRALGYQLSNVPRQ
jgi:hypothetical protein